LIATLVAAASGYAMLRHAHQTAAFDGVAMVDGGGWTALVIAEFAVALGAIAVALA
jgi:hypothetical protein